MSLLSVFPPFVQGLLEPAVILSLAVRAYIELALQDILENRRLLADLRNRAFGKFWSAFSGAPPDPSVVLSGSAALVPPLLAQSKGLVLDIGPGSGNLVTYFDRATKQIKRIYGAEPTVKLHESIRKNTANTAVGSRYEILFADATRQSISKELARAGVINSTQDNAAIFDTIVCVRVLCSVPNLEATISDLHALLKPGGKLLVCEHTINKWQSPQGSLLARLAQGIYMLLGWAYFVGDCSLVRDTENVLRRGGEAMWESIDLKRNFDQSVFTYISGTLTKRSSIQSP